MVLRKYIIAIFCMLACCSVYAQELCQQTRSIPQEALKIDLNKSSDVWRPILNNHSPQRANNGWYPVKGESYYLSETKIAGYISFEIGYDGLLDKRITIGNSSNFYDSTVAVMNRTPYTQGKDLIDTVYNYLKNPESLQQLLIHKLKDFIL